MPQTSQHIALPARIYRKIFRRFDRLIARLGSRSRFWAAIYYGFINEAYAREHKANLAGRFAYQDSVRHPSGSMALLRRNVHRLEKGLLMRPRRVPFALNYIEETVEAFLTAKSQTLDPCEMAWATDVLTEYFRVNAGESSIRPFNERFSCSHVPNAASRPQLIPQPRDFSSPLPVDYTSLLRLARHRRSVRWFLQEPVPRGHIDRALEIGLQAPSACNRQPFHFRVFDDRKSVQQIIDIPGGTAGYGQNVPVVVVVIGEQRNFFSERDRHLIYIDASLATMGFLFALEVQGISSCCINWPDIEEQEQRLAALLHLAPDERPIMLIAIGYPDPEAMVAASAKKSLQVIRRFNFE